MYNQPEYFTVRVSRTYIYFQSVLFAVGTVVEYVRPPVNNEPDTFPMNVVAVNALVLGTYFNPVSVFNA